MKVWLLKWHFCPKYGLSLQDKGIWYSSTVFINDQSISNVFGTKVLEMAVNSLKCSAEISSDGRVVQMGVVQFCSCADGRVVQDEVKTKYEVRWPLLPSLPSCPARFTWLPHRSAKTVQIREFPDFSRILNWWWFQLLQQKFTLKYLSADQLD